MVFCLFFYSFWQTPAHAEQFDQYLDQMKPLRVPSVVTYLQITQFSQPYKNIMGITKLVSFLFFAFAFPVLFLALLTISLSPPLIMLFFHTQVCISYFSFSFVLQTSQCSEFLLFRFYFLFPFVHPLILSFFFFLLSSLHCLWIYT